VAQPAAAALLQSNPRHCRRKKAALPGGEAIATSCQPGKWGIFPGV